MSPLPDKEKIFWASRSHDHEASTSSDESKWLIPLPRSSQFQDHEASKSSNKTKWLIPLPRSSQSHNNEASTSSDDPNRLVSLPRSSQSDDDETSTSLCNQLLSLLERLESPNKRGWKGRPPLPKSPLNPGNNSRQIVSDNADQEHKPQPYVSALERCQDDVDCLRASVPPMQRRLVDLQLMLERNEMLIQQCVEGNDRIVAEMEAENKVYENLVEEKRVLECKMLSAEFKLDWWKRRNENIQDCVTKYKTAIMLCNETNTDLEKKIRATEKDFYHSS